jgi:hypothetical protein
VHFERLDESDFIGVDLDESDDTVGKTHGSYVLTSHGNTGGSGVELSRHKLLLIGVVVHVDRGVISHSDNLH